ncbi:MAG: DUF87 domain-containing protein [Candidatus Methanofastidiosa archaeon]|nr:DUF87 domain-containing protein [Candidatus Methanofastidiosa archaeon]
MVRESVQIGEPLKLLSDGNNVFVGRKQSVFEKHRDRSGLYLGKIYEEQTSGRNLIGRPILLDSISPHAIFICGMRGSGKSYTLGVIAEEMATKNQGAGVIIIDPMGIFWSMKYPNKVPQEKKNLKRWELSPKGFKNVNVFMPSGFSKDIPENTYDNEFTIKPSEISVEEWCLTFDIDRFDTMGLLIERAIEKVKNGYTNVDGEEVLEKGEDYDISDLVDCINSEDSINSASQGFKQTTRRAMIARLNGANEWGVFAKEGTKLNDLSKRGVVTVIDVSFLDDNVRALVVGIIARNLLNTRKKISRHEATGNLRNIFGSIPVTWLMIDEAHILVPASGQKTAASDSLIEYVRQGRQPGCSLVLATQQPSAIDSRILSQTDILVCHKLVYDDDIKAVTRRMPSEMPAAFKNAHFIKNLPIGIAIIGDKQEQTSRSFLAAIRPRISQHEGRERTSTIDIDPVVLKKNIKELVEEKYSEGRQEDIFSIVDSIEHEYGMKIDLDAIMRELTEEDRIDVSDVGPEFFEELEGKGGHEADIAEEGALEPEHEAVVHKELLELPIECPKEEKHPPDKHPEQPVPSEMTSLMELPLDIAEAKKEHIDYSRVRIIYEKVRIEDITELADKKRKRRIFGSKEHLVCNYMVYYPIWQITYDYFPRKRKYASLSTYVDGITGELILKHKKGTRTRGMRELLDLSVEERDLLLYLVERENATYADIEKDIDMKQSKAKTLVDRLLARRLVKIMKKGEYQEIHPYFDLDIVSSPLDKRVSSVAMEYGEEFVEKGSLIDFVISDQQARKVIEFFEHIHIWSSDKIYYPYWVAVYEDGKSKRVEVFDALTGKTDEDAREMLRYRI